MVTNAGGGKAWKSQTGTLSNKATKLSERKLNIVGLRIFNKENISHAAKNVPFHL